MNILRNSLIATSLTAVMLASSALAGTYTVIEQAIESSTRDVRLPGTVNSTLFVRECSDCEGITLRITNDTQCEVNNVPLSYAEFQSVTEDHNGSLVIFYNDKTNSITRLVMKGNFVLDLPSRDPANDDRTDPAQASH